MNKKLLMPLVIAGLLTGSMAFSQVIQRFGQTAGLATTHSLNLTNLTVGITENGGGMINKLGVKVGGTLVDIMDGNHHNYTEPGPDGNTYTGISQSKTFGRGGQVTIRDGGHSGRYNPTQSGFNEFVGTPCTINTTTATNATVLTVTDHKMALWYGDGEYDFTSWENIAYDVYSPHTTSQTLIGVDDDGVDESNAPYLLPNKQQNEVGSEFNYYGTYKDFTSSLTGTNLCSVVKHFHELAFVGKSDQTNLGNPDNCLRQFQANGKKRTVNSDTPPDGSVSIVNSKVFKDHIFNTVPAGYNAFDVAGTSWDMNGAIVSYRLRYDTQKWQGVNEILYRNLQGTLAQLPFAFSPNGSAKPAETGTSAQITDNTLIAISDGTTVLAIYRPNSNTNKNFIIGREGEGRTTAVYQDNRFIDANDGVGASASYAVGNVVTNSLGVFGFGLKFSGMYNPAHLPVGTGGQVHETYRGDYYIISGPKSNLLNTLNAIDSNLNITSLLTSTVESKKLLQPTSKTALVVYPNPVTDILNIDIGSTATDIFIYNETGKLVYSAENGSGTLSIPKSNIGSPGIYFLKTKTETIKIVISQ